MKSVTVTLNGRKIQALRGTTLSVIVGGETPCGGHGRCGKCKVIARGDLSEMTADEKALLTAGELANGVRLACLTSALGDCEIETPENAAEAQIVSHGLMTKTGLHPSFSRYGAAIDIGTTTLAASLYDREGNLLAETSRLNPQQKWGADVISRVEAALNGRADDLTGAVRRETGEILCELAEKAGADVSSIDGAVITGNTVMLSLFCGESVEPFSHAPFAVSHLFGETRTARELGLTVLAPDTAVYFPPCLSAFVGADFTCAILATGLTRKGAPTMLADIGTNGEMAIWNGEKLTVCSTAAGPAFEGVGISMGMRGNVGAIDRVSVREGTLCAHVIGETDPTGLCGSGLVDAAACMLDVGVLDESGYLKEDPFAVRLPVTITQKDIRMLQLAKSAICAGLMSLIRNGGTSPENIAELFVAGGFGYYLDPKNAEKIGLLPEGLAGKSEAVGNAALAGASMILLNGEHRKEAEKYGNVTTLLDLPSDPAFSELFLSGMGLKPSR